MELYTPRELDIIVERSASILGIKIEHEGAMQIARRSRGTPRIANRLLRRVRDFAEIQADGVITKEVADKGLDMLEVDSLGLDGVDRTLLSTMITMFKGRPVGLETLAAATGEEAATIEDVYEPYLMQVGFLMRTPRGRIVTDLAYEHLGLAKPGEKEREDSQGKLF